MNRYLLAAAPAPSGGAPQRPKSFDIIQWLWGTGKAVAQPAADFTRGVVRGTPKYVPVGVHGARQTTITASLQAGMQTRYVAREVGRVIIQKVPATGVGAIKYVARTAVRDTIIYPFYTPASIAVKGVQFFKLTPKFLSGLERRTATIFKTADKYLEVVKLRPSVLGATGAVARLNVYSYIERSTGALGDASDAIYQKSKQYIRHAHQAAGALVAPSQPVGVVPLGVPDGQVPPTVAGNHAPLAPVPPAPPANTEQGRSRQYIPIGRR